MAVQYTTYNTDGTTRTFPSTKHIATIQHVGVYLKRVVDNVWVVVNVNDYALVQNSIIFDTAPDSVLYAQVEVRVADDAAEITTSPSDIALVAGSIVNVDTVATNIGAVNTVATNVGAVTTTSGSIANVNTVAANIVNVNLAAGNTANINAVVANAANVTAVGLDLLEPESEINTVALSIANVNTVGSAIVNVNTVATNMANVNSVATTIVPNIAEILLADDNATTATTQAGIATTQAGLASTSATNAQLRAWEAEAKRLTADSYATEAEDVLVKSYSSNGDGTFTATNTTEYSALHWSNKALINANFAPAIHGATSKVTPVDADEIPIADSAATFGLKKLTLGNLKTTFGVLFAPLASPALTGTVSINGANVTAYGKNYIINGGFDYWNYATSQTTSGYGSDDRWINANIGSTKTHSRVASGDAERDLFNSPYYSRTVVTSNLGVGNGVFKYQRIENITKLAGKTVTFSFWAKAGTTKNIAIEIEQHFGTGGTPSATISSISSQQISLTSAWQKKSITVVIPSIIGKTLGTDGVHTSSTTIRFWFDAGSDYNSNSANLGQQSGTFDIAEVKLEEGSVATPWTPYEGEFGGEVQACQRYLPVFTADSTVSYIDNGASINTTQASIDYHYFTETRVVPSGIVVSDPASFSLNDGNTSYVLTGLSFLGASKKEAVIYGTTTGLTAFRLYRLFGNAIGAKIYFTGCEL